MAEPIGAIDPEQRHVAERLAIQALRRFHREQPLAADLRMDALVSRVRALAARSRPRGHRGGTPLTLADAELRRVIDDLAADGRLVRDGRRLRLPEAQAGLDPQMGERVETLIAGLRAAGSNPPRVDGIAARLGIPPNVVDQLRATGALRAIAPGIDYPADVWAALRARVDEIRGPMSVARLRDELRTSRRHAEAILATVEGRPRRPSPRRSRSS
ncbi:MAG: hypothetical protein LC744_03740 [Chloroflexi bacterium]|nr:hypothetical protein [Chloroflexota bacterium]